MPEPSFPLAVAMLASFGRSKPTASFKDSLAEAVEAIARRRDEGANYLVQTWEAYWSDRSYEGFVAFMDQQTRCLIANDRCRIFEFLEPEVRCSV